MSFFRRYWQACIFFLVSFLAYLPALFGHGFADPDAFYHAKVSSLLWLHGPLHAFPWLDLTLVGQAYADLHFLFHAWVAPFTAVFGLMDGLRVASLCLVLLLGIVFAGSLYWLNLRFVWIWSAVLLLMPPLFVRFSLGKASALAVLWLLFGICAALKRRPWAIALAVGGFGLSHGAWVLLVLCVVYIGVMEAFFTGQLFPSPLSFWARIRGQMGLFAAAMGGGMVAIFFHPNFPENIRFTWVQLVTIGLGTPTARVVMGKEWASPDVAGMLSACAPVLLLVALACLVVLHTKPHFSLERMVQILGVTSLLGVFVACAFLSVRSLEYVLPVAVLLLAFVFSGLDIGRFCQEQRKLALFGFALFFLVIGFQNGRALHRLWQSAYADTLYVSALHAIRAAGAKDGERVFHPFFDRFPLLFAQDDGLRYVTGLDPTFLLVTDPALSDRIDLSIRHPERFASQDIAWMLQRTDSRFVFLAKVGPYMRWVELLQQEKSLYTAIFEDSSSLVFERQK